MLVKCPYFPNIFYEQHITRFGAIETSVNPYNQKIHCRTSDVKTYVIDCYQCLEELWGKEICNRREALYTLMSGDSNLTKYKEAVAVLYAESPNFANFLNMEKLFGNQEIPLVERIVQPAREKVNDFIKNLTAFAQYNSGKAVMVDKDFIYLTFTKETEMPYKIKECYV